MADIVLGLGTSHGPLLNTPPSRWGERARFDRTNQALAYRGRDYSFDDLLELRGAGFGAECAPEVQEKRHAACRAALDALGAIVADSDVDTLVIVSGDHKEIFSDEVLAPFTIYTGENVDHVPFTEEQLAAMPPGLAVAAVGDVPAVRTVRPCDAELAVHLVREAGAAGFDPASSAALPAGRYGNRGIPHGWGFVYQQLLLGQPSLGEAPTPFVPVFVNTFYEPTPPSAARCYAFGRALGAALRSSGAPARRVGLVASGGLSHFVVDEQLDRDFLAALVAKDERWLTELDPATLRSGTSELRNWIVVAGALADTGLDAEVIDYQPCYRTEAGTGCAMGFAAWR